jgi:ketosteroid isomerase-like protein
MRRINEVFFSQFDDLRLEVHEAIDAGDQVFISFTVHGRGQHSGVRTSWDNWTVWTVRDGRVTRLLGFTDRAEALEAAGLEE